MVILLLTGLPGSCFPSTRPHIVGLDKVGHFLMYAGFAYAALWGYRKPLAEKGKAYRRKAFWITLAVSIALGTLTEIMQGVMGMGRDCDFLDWIADLIGSIVGIATYYFFHRKKK